MKKARLPLRWVVWSLAAIFYLYEFILRVAPSVMISELMQMLAVNATAIGALSAFYFYIYAPLQLPVGPLTDKYGARLLLSLSAFIAGLGTLFFAMASTYWIAAVGRLFMGIGSAFGFVGMIYVCTHWFEASKRGVMIGLANTIGMLGAILGQGPLRFGLNAFGWRPTLYGLAIFGFLLAALIYLFVRNDPSNEDSNPLSDREITFFKNLLLICKNPGNWVNGCVGLFFYLTTAVFAGLWGIPFFTTAYGISTETAGYAISMVFVGWAIGGPLIGIYSDRIQQKKSILLTTTGLAALLMILVIYIPHLPLPLLFTLLFLVGCLSSAELLIFSYAIDINPPYAKATALAFTNFVNVLGTAALQPLVGSLLDAFWSGGLTDGVRMYSLKDYYIAMSSFPLSLMIAFIFALFLKQHKGRRIA